MVALGSVILSIVMRLHFLVSVAINVFFAKDIFNKKFQFSYKIYLNLNIVLVKFLFCNEYRDSAFSEEFLDLSPLIEYRKMVDTITEEGVVVLKFLQ